MNIKRLYKVLKDDYNIEYVIRTILNESNLKPVCVHSPSGESIGYRIDGRIIRLYLKSLKDNLILIDESADKITETYIDLEKGQTKTILIKRDDSSLKIIKIERFFDLKENALIYIEEDHRTYSFDKIRKIYNIPSADLEFAGMRNLLKNFKYIDEDALVEGIKEDIHNTLVVYDNKYMKLSDEDVVIVLNDNMYKFKYEDNYLDFITSSDIKKLKRV